MKVGFSAASVFLSVSRKKCLDMLRTSASVEVGVPPSVASAACLCGEESGMMNRTI